MLDEIGHCGVIAGRICVRGEKLTAPQLIEMANANNPALRDAIRDTFDAKDLKEATAWIGRGPDFFFAAEAIRNLRVY